MPSAIDDTVPVEGRPTTESVRDNFGIAKAELTALQARVSDAPAAPVETSLLLAWRDESGVLHPVGRVMVDVPDPGNNGNRWLYLRVD
jgi:hypothetical protein